MMLEVDADEIVLEEDHFVLYQHTPTKHYFIVHKLCNEYVSRRTRDDYYYCRYCYVAVPHGLLDLKAVLNL